jgi:hypothetical protein
MSDLFSPFRDAEQLPTPPASEIRHRGDALRRRRQALQAGGVAALVAVVALGVAGLSGGLTDSSSEAPPATQQTTAPSTPETSTPSDRITTIPASIDLAQGLVDSGSDDELASGPQVSWLADEVVCDADHSPADLETDRTAAVLTMPQHTTARDLRVYADDATAQGVATELVGWFRACPTFSIDGGASETTNTVVEGEPRGSSWTVTQTYTSGGQPQIGQNILLVRHVGNAVLVVKDYGEGPGATDRPELLRQVRALQAETEPVVLELECTFGNAGGC